MTRTLPGRWDVTAPPLVRVAGVPVSALVGLRSPDLFARIDALLATRDRLTADGAALSAELYRVIGVVDDPAVRSALVGLRRALGRARRPSGREWNPAVAELVPALAPRLDAWIGDLASWRHDRAALPDIIETHEAAQRAALREALAHDGLRRALCHAMPPLFAEVERWLADERRPPQRQKILRLVKYLARASAKTSPYGTLMTNGIGTWTEGGPALAFDAAEVHGVLQVGGGYLGMVRRGLERSPELSEVVPVRVNPTAAEHDGKVQFIRGDHAESIVSVPSTPSLRACLRLIADDGGITLAGLRSRLLAVAGDDAGGAVESYLDRLVAAGLVEPHVPVADHAADWFGDVRRWLAGQVGEQPAALAKLVGRVGEELRRAVPVADVEAHRARLSALSDAMDELADRLGLPGSPGRGRGAGCHESAVVRGPVVRCATPRWRPALADLDVLREYFSIFDESLPGKLALGAYVRERFGAGAQAPLLTVYRAVCEELNRAAGGGDAAEDLRAILDVRRSWASAPREARLDRLLLLGRLRAEARRLIADAPADDDGIIRVNPETLRAAAAQWPQWIVRRDSVGCYVQPMMAGEDLRLVLNLMVSGHGQGAARLRYLVGDPAGRREADRPGVVFAELGGLLGSTLNVRAPTVRHEIVLPSTVSARPAAERIAVAELVVRHDADTDTVGLYAPRLRATVVPLHLGTLAAISLPPLAGFLARVFAPGGQLGHPAMPPTIDRDGLTDGLTDGAGVVSLRRIEVGRVVARRARWVMRTDRIPRRRPGESDADHLLRMVAWRHADGIPARCFVRIWSDPHSVVFTKARKPLYVDFTSLYSVHVFEREIRDGCYVSFDEELPAVGEARWPDPAGPAVVEMLVELTRAGSDD